MAKPIGIYTEIVEILREYGQISIGYLAYRLGRGLDDISDDIHQLEMDGIIEVEGENVNLVGQKKSRWWRMKS